MDRYIKTRKFEEAVAAVDKLAASYNQKGSSNNNYKGSGKRGYSADHKAAAKRIPAKKCVKCGSTKDVQRAIVKGSNGTKYMSLCRSCHAKYDNVQKNINKK